jgi:hypothetical protein
MFVAGLLILGMLFGVLLTIVGTVWLGSLADEGIRIRVLKRHPEGDWQSG